MAEVGPAPGVQPRDQLAEQRQGLGGRERAMSGALHEGLAQQVPVAGTVHRLPVRGLVLDHHEASVDSARYGECSSAFRAIQFPGDG